MHESSRTKVPGTRTSPVQYEIPQPPAGKAASDKYIEHKAYPVSPIYQQRPETVQDFSDKELLQMVSAAAEESGLKVENKPGGFGFDKLGAPGACTVLGGDEKLAIRSRARRVLETYGYDFEKEPCVDTVKLARLFGFIVSESNLKKSNIFTKTYGQLALETRDGQPFRQEIVVDQYLPKTAKRFVITYMLCEYLLRHIGDGNFVCNCTEPLGESLEEREDDAAYMATHILMPAESFISARNKLAAEDKSITRIVCGLEKNFEMSRLAVYRRIVEICAPYSLSGTLW